MLRIIFAALTVAAAVVGAQATPAYWTVHEPKGGTAYLVSSLHLLPRGTEWHNDTLEKAMASSDSFVFEVPTGVDEHREETRFIYHRGLLPDGQTLTGLLDDTGKRDYARALEMAGMQASALDQKQPWLAEVVLTVQAMYRRNYSAENTPEGYAHYFAAHGGKDIRYLDTTRQQMEFLAGANPDGDIGKFSAVLADFPNQAEREQHFVDAWLKGDVSTSATLVSTGLHDYPDAWGRLVDRNKAWAEQIKDMLRENRTFFVAVGIAHLVGPEGVPALLRAKGIAVDGP
ncbi:MAG: TraB/GumN family protein [Alphaproteobacteria bacterium]|nr:TraB/GumN family protein [Alphaproteobacteria bacterium]MBL6939039.1 TraB/GumN family protein [Alphaproteobacteria bacterium]MBL7099631.1 TraB/GumN family protein [Alphaproteobacteria bacterium]